MPTIAEPLAPTFVPSSWPPTPLNLRAHADAIRLDLQDRGIPPTRLVVIGYATDSGVPGPIAATLADMLEESGHA